MTGQPSPTMLSDAVVISTFVTLLWIVFLLSLDHQFHHLSNYLIHLTIFLKQSLFLRVLGLPKNCAESLENSHVPSASTQTHFLPPSTSFTEGDICFNDEPTLTPHHHLKSIVPINIHAWCCFGLWKMYNVMYLPLWYHMESRSFFIVQLKSLSPRISSSYPTFITVLALTCYTPRLPHIMEHLTSLYLMWLLECLFSKVLNTDNLMRGKAETMLYCLINWGKCLIHYFLCGNS